MAEYLNFPNKKIIVGITGGVAAYKSIGLCSYLKQQGADVYPVMTRGSEKFINKNMFRAITGKDALVEVWEEPFENKIAHIHLADEADLIVVVPATANFIAKHANGIADDMLSNILLAVSNRQKVLFCPAMNVNMYNHPATQKNLVTLMDYGINILEPSTGYLACGYEAEGKLPDTDVITKKMLSILYPNR